MTYTKITQAKSTHNQVDAIANHFMQLEVEADDPLMYQLQQGA